MPLFSKKLDFLAIGDTVTDAFIHLSQADVLDSVDHSRKELCVTFGDKVPYDYVKVIAGVGNSANAAVSAARLGLRTALATDIGVDQYGREMLAALKKNAVAGRFITAHSKMESNYHYALWYDVERTILVKHQKYPYSFARIGRALSSSFGRSSNRAPKWIYLSSLGENSLPYHKEIESYLAANPGVKLAFQPGTYQMKFGTTELAGIYRRTELFFCNREEAQRILATDEKDVKILMTRLAALGPKIVFVTDGMEGAYAYDARPAAGIVATAGEAWFMPIYPHKPFERTGAGDAFSSTVTVALALGKTLPEALSWGPINSQSVVQYVGAQEGLLSREKLLDFLAKGPADYKARKV